MTKNNDKESKNKTDSNDFVLKLLPEVFVSTGDVQKFNPQNIMNSIITETGLSKKSAKEVTEFVVRRIIASGIKFLSGPHIRELVCSALSEMHFEEERKKFTRIGMPINDYENLLKSRFNERTMEYTAPENIHRWASGQLSTEYTLLKILTNEQTREHLMGNIHIHSLNYFDMRPFAQAWDLRMVYKYGFPPASFLNFTKAKPANNAMTAVLHTCKWLGFAHSEFSGEQNCLYINTLLSPFLKGLEYKNIKQLAQTLIFEINQQYITQGSHVPITSITTSPTIPKVLKNVDAIGPAGKIVGVYGDYEKENQLLFNAISEVYNEGDENGKYFAFPKHIILIEDNSAGDDSFYNVILEETINKGTAIFINAGVPWLKDTGYLGTFFSNEYKNKYLSKIGEKDLFNWSKTFMNLGAIQSVSINLPRIIYETKGEDPNIEALLDKRMNNIKEILIKKRDIINQLISNKHLMLCSHGIDGKPIFDLKKQALVIGFVGLNEMALAKTGSQLYESDISKDFGKKILTLMAKKCNEFTEETGFFFTLWEQPAEFISHRFAALDFCHSYHTAELYVNGNKKNGAVYYSPSAHVNYGSKISFEQLLKIYSEVGSILQNNSSMPIWLSNSPRNNDKSIIQEKIKQILKYNISEFSFNFDYSLCPKCKYFVKDILNKCPKCDSSEDLKVLAKITNYYSPVELWNEGKKQEFRDRVRIDF